MISHTTPKSAFGSTFVQLNRSLTDASSPDQWNPAVTAMHAFLHELERSVHDKGVSSEEASLEDMAKTVSILLTLSAEIPQYRHETFVPKNENQLAFLRTLQQEMFPLMAGLRMQAIQLLKVCFTQPIFESIGEHISEEIFPLLDQLMPNEAPERYMPFRIVLLGDIFERLYSFRVRTSDPAMIGNEEVPGLLRRIFDRKYLRFGTSGVRGRWALDFTEVRAKQVTQAICDFLTGTNTPDWVKAENLSGKILVVGYDSRRNARKVAEWVAQVCIANGLKVHLANRDTPTPALVYYLTDGLNPADVAGLINCTASHNPPEWQGIKFNPRLGYPAPTNITDFIAARANELQLLDRQASTCDLDAAASHEQLLGFDPIDRYVQWVLASGNGNQRIPLDLDRIRRTFSGRQIVVDEMHGSGRGYLTRLLGEIGVRYTVIHAEQDPDIPTLDYANPEEPYIQALKDKVHESGAAIGLALDTDADRFGIVEEGGVYYRPNQVLPMLVKYLGLDRGLTGRVGATVTGSPLIDILASKMDHNRVNEPDLLVPPAYISHPFYRLMVGNPADRAGTHAWVVMVGIKYIEELRRVDNKYQSLSLLPDNWRDTLLIAGEESSGLTTRGHVTDKDGIWADLLVLDMVAYYATRDPNPLSSIRAIWKETCEVEGCWEPFSGFFHRGSNSGRQDVDAVLEAKEQLINHYLDTFLRDTHTANQVFDGMDVVFAGGVRYDLVEFQLRDRHGDDRHYLRIRASGTEPINRIYVESSDANIATLLMNTVLAKLDELTVAQIRAARSPWRLVSILAQSTPSVASVQAVQATIRQRGWTVGDVTDKLQATLPILENRNRRVAVNWIELLNTDYNWPQKLDHMLT